MASIKARETASGTRYDVRYRTPEGGVRTATKADLREARAFASKVEGDKARGRFIDPRSATITFEQYSEQWLAERPLRPRTLELYDGLLRKHIGPTFNKKALGRITPSMVRTWNAKLRATEAPSVAPKAYRLFRTIMGTAIEDERIERNPANLKGAGTEHHAERPVCTIERVYQLAETVEPRYRALVLVATFTGLRLGELSALTRERFNMLHRTVSVVEQYQRLAKGGMVLGEPKTDAGRRTVNLPAFLVPEVEAHLARYVDPEPDALVFAGPEGAPLCGNNWNPKWRAACDAVGTLPPKFRFHDLRGTGNTIAAATGASLKELMTRLGHASPRAALLYQHATAEGGRKLAAGIDEAVRESRGS